MGGRIVLVALSPRIPPGLLSWPAWEALRSGPVRTADDGSPQLPFLRDAGVDVRVEQPDAEALHASALAGRAAVWFAPDAELVRAVGQRSVAGGAPVELVHGSYDPPGARLLDVVAVMDRLRSPGGCPWDAEQTHTTLMPYLLEEAYEAYAALEDGDLVDKLVRRHPHVFAGTSADDLEGTWEALKKAEKGRTSVTDGVPLSQPALALAAKLQGRAARLGAPVPAFDGLGGELWELVRRCRAAGLDPELALRTTARAYRDRLAAAEAAVLAEGGEPAALSAGEWAARWA